MRGSFATTCLPFAKAFIISSNCYHIHLGLGSVTQTEVGRLHQIQPKNGHRICNLAGGHLRDAGFRQSTINQTLRVTTKQVLVQKGPVNWVTYGIVYHRVLHPLLVRFKRRWGKSTRTGVAEGHSLDITCHEEQTITCSYMTHRLMAHCISKSCLVRPVQRCLIRAISPQASWRHRISIRKGSAHKHFVSKSSDWTWSSMSFVRSSRAERTAASEKRRVEPERVEDAESNGAERDSSSQTCFFVPKTPGLGVRRSV